MDKEEQQIVSVNMNMSAIYIDAFSIIPWTDDLLMVCGHQRFPDGKMCEQIRYLTTSERSKRFVDNLCKALNYYPERDQESEEEILPKPKPLTYKKRN